MSLYVAIFDAHIGAPGWEAWYPALERVVTEWRSKGARIIWAGDTLDQSANSSVSLSALPAFREEDVWLYGNHDPYPPEGVRAQWHYVTEEGVLIAHGDALDFQYIAALLGEALGGRIRREHALMVYQAAVAMPDSLTRALIHWGGLWLKGKAPTPWRLVLAALPYILPALLWEAPSLFPTPKDLPRVNPLSKDPKDIEARLLAMYGHLRWERAVVGHLHPEAPILGGRVVVSQGWPTWPNAGYVVIQGECITPMKVNVKTPDISVTVGEGMEG